MTMLVRSTAEAVIVRWPLHLYLYFIKIIAPAMWVLLCGGSLVCVFVCVCGN